jgi:hypothetical protein
MDSLHPVIDKTPYTYVLSTRDANVEGVSIKLVKDPLSRKRNFIRYTSIALLAGGIGAAIFGYERYDNSKSDFEALSSDNVSNLNQNSTSDWKDARRDRNLDFTLLSGGITASVLGAVGLTWTFTF